MTIRPAARGWPPAAGLALALLAATVLAVWLWTRHQGALVDDAFISFRYAARWAAGSGLTWNDGAAVEGYSNPLWTMVLGLLARLGVPPHLAAPALGWGALGATVASGWALARRRGLSGPWGWLLAGGLATDVGLALWAGSGLETVTCALLVALWLWVAAGLGEGTKGSPVTGLVLGLVGAALALSRPEGSVWALWGLAWLVWGAWAGPRLLVGWVVGMAPVVAYAAFRWIHFGAILPNTFFAKVEPAGGRSLAHGAGDLGLWALAHAVPLAAALGAAALIWGRGRRREMNLEPERGGSAPRMWLWLAAGWLGAQVLFVLAVGGDWMGHARYMAPTLPALYLLAAEGASRKFPGVSGRPAVGAAALILLVHLSLGWAVRDTIPDYTRGGRDLGLWLKSAADPGDTVAVTAAGAVPYFSELAAYDVLGINDPEVAGRLPRHTGPWTPGHHRYDLDRLLELRPRWIVWDFGVLVNERRLRELRDDVGDPDRLDYRRALLARAEFRRLYTIERGAPASTQRIYTVFRRR